MRRYVGLGMIVVVAMAGSVAAGGRARAINPADPVCGSPQKFNGGTGAFYSNQFASNYVTAPPTGAADVPNSRFMNVFLFPNSDTQTWDQHRLTLPVGKQGPTMEQIDAMTRDVVCSSYFDLLTQYNINPPTFEGDVATSSSCVNSALSDAVSTQNVISYATMRTFAGCEQSVSAGNPPQVNIFVSPDVMSSAFGEDTLSMCSNATTTAAYHGWGIGVPNFTVIPTVASHSCDVPGEVLDSLTHEMVELVSDPGGFGWLHASDIGHVDLNKQLAEGELADICSSVGAYPTPADKPGFIPFPVTPDLVTLGLANLFVAPYWSDQDNACEPTAIMNDTLESLSGNPLKRMTGGKQDLPIPITQANPPAGILDSLELDVVTGQDNLNSSSGFSVIVRATVAGKTVNIQQNAVNQGAEWGGNTLHAVMLPFPPGISVSAITNVTVHTELSGDNWDIGAAVVQAAVLPDTSGCGAHSFMPVDATTPAKPLLSDGHNGIVRMIGGSPQSFGFKMSAVGSTQKDLLVTKLLLSVATTGDDLRGGNSPGDNADAVLSLAGGGTVVFPNINRNMNWVNDSTSQQLDLLKLNSLPPQTKASDITGFALRTNLPGGGGGDNWDVGNVQLFAQLGCKAASKPMTATTTLVDAVGNAVLADGSTGLCRLTGFVHDCFVTIPIPPFDPSDGVVALNVTITTGDDDLRGSGLADDNARVTVGGFPTFTNVNQFQNLPNKSVRSIPLAPLPAKEVPLVKLGSITVSTDFGGGTGGDNWDIKEIKLDATVVVPSLSAARFGAGASAIPSATLGALGRLGTGSPTPFATLMSVVTAPSPWTVVTSPSPGTGDNVLNGITCQSPTSCFAVGATSPNTDAPQALIEKWDGAVWTVMPAPNTGEQYSVLNGVACTEPTDCVAVGFDGSGATEGSAGTAQLLIERWNGTTWNVVQSGNPIGDTASVLTGVSCVNVPQVFCAAVGYQSGIGVAQTLTMQFQDGGWSITPSPNADDGNNILYGVSCTSPTHCAAVGHSDRSGIAQTLALKWDGSSWNITPSGNAGVMGNVYDGMGNNFLYSVSCYSEFDCVAVGATIDAHRISRTLIETTSTNPDGAWEPQPSPNPGASGSMLRGVSCTSATNCTAVGVQFDGDIDATLNLNWDGVDWFATPTPSPAPTRNFLLADTCIGPALCIAVGDGVDDTRSMKQTLVMNFVATPPNEPTNAVALPGNAQAEVSFTPPTDNGGRRITSYTVTATDVTNPALSGQTALGSASPITMLALHNGDTYTFTVTATNAVGDGPPSLPTAPIVVKAAGTTKFTPLTLQNGWFGAPFETGVPGVALKAGIVYFNGAMATVGTNAVAFTLPAKFRPTTTVYVPVDMCDAANGRLRIDPTGVATVEAEGGAFSNAACFTSLDGVEFVQTAATPLVLQNGWTTTAFGTAAPAAVSAGNIVHLQGAMTTASASPIAFTLPVAMRPKVIVHLPVDLCNATNGRLVIDTNGVATVEAEGGAFSNASCFTSLDGVRFALKAKTPLVLQNGWTSAAGTPGPTAVAKGGLVFLAGALTTGGANASLFTLPVQLRPAVHEYVKVSLCNAANGRLAIDPSGVVSVQAEGAVFLNAQCLTSLDGAFYNR